MAYSQTNKKHRRQLEALKTQLYGKESSVSYRPNTSTVLSTEKSPSTHQHISINHSYLKKDLAKIALLSTLAIGSQLVIYFLIQKKIIAI